MFVHPVSLEWIFRCSKRSYGFDQLRPNLWRLKVFLFSLIFQSFSCFFMKLHQNWLCNKRFNHKKAFLNELLLLNSKHLILFNIDRVVNPDRVRILCKNLGKFYFVMMQQWQIENQNNATFSIHWLNQIYFKID